VLITGASSGIGEALARRVAGERRDVALVARRIDRLETLAHGLRERHGVAVDVIPSDLLAPDAVSRLVDEVARRDLQVDWLVNNAGFGTAGRFDELPIERELEIIRLNVRALVELAGRFLPAMIERRRGLVLNVASVAGFGPMAFNATYGASKAFVVAWSEALAVEMAETGVRVVCVCPGFTRTEFQEVAPADTPRIPDFAWMSADEVAAHALASVQQSGVAVSGLMNNVLTTSMRLMPRSAIAAMTARAMRNRAR
jgi:short-subunit dehydrogenase